MLKENRVYRLTDPNAYPSNKVNADVTIRAIYPQQRQGELNISYSYAAKDGSTGEGMMEQGYAEQFLVPKH